MNINLTKLITNLTDEIKNVSPHGVKMLDRVPVVGKLAE